MIYCCTFSNQNDHCWLDTRFLYYYFEKSSQHQNVCLKCKCLQITCAKCSEISNNVQKKHFKVQFIKKYKNFKMKITLK